MRVGLGRARIRFPIAQARRSAARGGRTRCSTSASRRQRRSGSFPKEGPGVGRRGRHPRARAAIGVDRIGATGAHRSSRSSPRRSGVSSRSRPADSSGLKATSLPARGAPWSARGGGGAARASPCGSRSRVAVGARTETLGKAGYSEACRKKVAPREKTSCRIRPREYLPPSQRDGKRQQRRLSGAGNVSRSQGAAHGVAKAISGAIRETGTTA